jgi:hypothetical protein
LDVDPLLVGCRQEPLDLQTVEGDVRVEHPRRRFAVRAAPFTRYLDACVEERVLDPPGSSPRVEGLERELPPVQLQERPPALGVVGTLNGLLVELDGFVQLSESAERRPEVGLRARAVGVQRDGTTQRRLAELAQLVGMQLPGRTGVLPVARPHEACGARGGGRSDEGATPALDLLGGSGELTQRVVGGPLGRQYRLEKSDRLQPPLLAEEVPAQLRGQAHVLRLRSWHRAEQRVADRTAGAFVVAEVVPSHGGTEPQAGVARHSGGVADESADDPPDEACGPSVGRGWQQTAEHQTGSSGEVVAGRSTKARAQPSSAARSIVCWSVRVEAAGVRPLRRITSTAARLSR